MKLFYTFFNLILVTVFLFSSDENNFVLIEKDNGKNIFYFDSKSIEVKILDGKKHLKNVANDLEDLSYYPSQSTFYYLEDGTDISASYNVNSSYYEEDMFVDESLHSLSSKKYFPEQNLIISEPMIFRGLVVKQVTFYPYRLNLKTGKIEIFDDVEIVVEEFETNQSREYTHTKRSKAFEPLYEAMVVNYEPSSREEDYQVPAVLYICGGSSLENSYVQDLIDWRRKSGSLVYTATTNEIGSSSSQVKNYIQDMYNNSENPPEIVGLIGDTSGNFSIGYFTESWSGYGGAGDMPYALLDGNDLLPEVHIGRISVSSNSELSNVINKTLAYEKATYLTQISNDWYERGALCGDPSSSGWSTVITNEYVGNILDAYGFEDVNGNYGNGNYSNWMEDQLEDGCLYMNYRGYYGSSGFGSSNINGANNGYKNPFAVFITCGTGDFNGTSLSEQLFRAGSVSSPKGAVAAIGTATTGTHTLFNNIVNMGIYDGIFPKNLGTAGGAMTTGRLALLWTYPSDPNNNVSIFSHWNNLMGDPALRLWTDTPKIINADFQSSIPFGQQFLDVYVEDDDGVPIANANITVLKDNDVTFKTVKTNDVGLATIEFEYNDPGEVHLTVTKQNCKPIESSFEIIYSSVSVNVCHDDIIIDDSSGEFTSGNGDGFLNPGETVAVYIPVINYGNGISYSSYGNLSTNFNNVNIINNINQYGDLSPTICSSGNYFYLLSLDSNTTQLDDLELRLFMSDENNNESEALINLDVQAGFLFVDHIQLLDNIELNPGEESEIQIFLTNSGAIALDDVQLSLLPSGYVIDIMNANTSFGRINAGETVGSTVDTSVMVHVDENSINGSVINMNANVTSSNGYNQNLMFDLAIGHVTQEDPLGPDEYGYYIYDSGDLGYSLAPFYDWIEIDNDEGGPGTELNMNDSGDGNNISTSSLVVDLPFPVTFYGVTYNQITVCTNGWISFGESLLESFRNYPVPGAGGPSPMLAAFWDDLKTSNNAEIYTYAGENYFIIEWSEMRTYFSNDIETFQIIIYDNSNLTPTGDNEIKIQYKTFNNTTQGSYSGWGGTHGGYSTIGLENHMSDMGLQYTFNNDYPTAAMPLSNETAIFITTRNPVATLIGDANQDGEINILDIVVIVNHIVNLELLDSMGVYMSDLDNSGSINILDIILIINIILENT